MEYGKCNNPSIELYINGFVTSNVILKPKYLRKTIKTTYISSQISNKNYLMSPFEYNADYFKFMKPLVTETRRRDYLKSLHKNRRNIKSTTGNKEIVDMFLTAIRHSMPTTSSIDEFTTKNFFSYPITNKNSESIIIDNILSEIKSTVPNEIKFKRNKSLVELKIVICNKGYESLRNFHLFIHISNDDYNNGVYFLKTDIMTLDGENDKKMQEYRYGGDNKTINGGMPYEMTIFINLPKEETILYLSYKINAEYYNSEPNYIKIENIPQIIEEKIEVKNTYDKAEEGIKTIIENIVE